MCRSEREWARQNNEVRLNGVVGARRTDLCQELQRCWDFHVHQFPVCIKNGPPPKQQPANLTLLWEALASIPVECFQHLLEPMPRQIEAVLRAKPGSASQYKVLGCSETEILT